MDSKKNSSTTLFFIDKNYPEFIKIQKKYTHDPLFITYTPIPLRHLVGCMGVKIRKNWEATQQYYRLWGAWGAEGSG